MKVETTPTETVAVILGIVIFVIMVFLIYYRDQLALTRTEEGRLVLQE